MGMRRGKTESKPVCPWCWYARDREDICGVYCVADYENKDGNCTHFLDYEEEKERRDADGI